MSARYFHRAAWLKPELDRLSTSVLKCGTKKIRVIVSSVTSGPWELSSTSFAVLECRFRWNLLRKWCRN